MRNWIKLSALLNLFLISINSFSQQEEYPFKNTSLSFEERVNDLVSRLTLEEKVGQMLNAAPQYRDSAFPRTIGGMRCCTVLHEHHIVSPRIRRQLPWPQHSIRIHSN
jgi:hypothetical protein